VPNFELVTRINVLSAIREYDELGAEAFLSTYGFGPAREYLLRHRGRLYDSKAILGVAHRYATGTVAGSDDFSGGREGAAKVLKNLEFEVVNVDADGKPATRARTSSPRPAAPRKVTPRSTKPEPVVHLCPTCYTQLPASSICDYCA
jgi:hypothetical protein